MNIDDEPNYEAIFNQVVTYLGNEQYSGTLQNLNQDPMDEWLSLVALAKFPKLKKITSGPADIVNCLQRYQCQLFSFSEDRTKLCRLAAFDTRAVLDEWVLVNTELGMKVFGFTGHISELSGLFLGSTSAIVCPGNPQSHRVVFSTIDNVVSALSKPQTYHDSLLECQLDVDSRVNLVQPDRTIRFESPVPFEVLECNEIQKICKQISSVQRFSCKIGNRVGYVRFGSAVATFVIGEINRQDATKSLDNPLAFKLLGGIEEQIIQRVFDINNPPVKPPVALKKKNGKAKKAKSVLKLADRKAVGKKSGKKSSPLGKKSNNLKFDLTNILNQINSL